MVCFGHIVISSIIKANRPFFLRVCRDVQRGVQGCAEGCAGMCRGVCTMRYVHNALRTQAVTYTP